MTLTAELIRPYASGTADRTRSRAGTVVVTIKARGKPLVFLFIRPFHDLDDCVGKDVQGAHRHKSSYVMIHERIKYKIARTP